MDLLYFLKSRLRFIEQLYDGAVSSFIDTKRKIDAGEPPYVDNQDPEYYDGEPAFLSEWQQAHDSVDVLGYWCLSAVQASLQAYLKAYVSPSGACWWNAKRLEKRLGDKPRKASWFEKYRLLFLGDLGIDWTSGPVSLDELEQLNLTRNDLNHNVDVMSLSVSRTREHAARFPDGLFTDELWTRDGMKFFGIDKLKVDKEKLSLAIKLVEEFCAWLEGIRCRYPHYIKETHGIDLLASRRGGQGKTGCFPCGLKEVALRFAQGKRVASPRPSQSKSRFLASLGMTIAVEKRIPPDKTRDSRASSGARHRHLRQRFAPAYRGQAWDRLRDDT